MTDEEFKDLIDSVENTEMNSNSNSNETKKIELTEAQKKTLEKAIEKQKKFMNGEVTKKKVSKKKVSKKKASKKG